ncbi:MAG: hypothetical protein GY702_27960 [Desulfobulbaceae bacterium]|nr:hypothetical protein [Desulfobulbaceae bacterium]
MVQTNKSVETNSAEGMQARDMNNTRREITENNGRKRLLRSCSMFFMFFMVLFTQETLKAEILIPLTVQKGTNLIKLTKQYCTSKHHWKELAKINKLTDPYILLPGDTLYAPIELVQKEMVTAKVVSVIGGVFILSDNKKLKRVQKGDLIVPGQTLVTEEDGFAHLIYPDNKYTRISSDSKFTLTYLIRLTDKSLKAEFFLERGRITHAVKKKLKKNENFTTRTIVSVTGVRGTEFRVKMGENEGNIIETLVGVVKVNALEKSINVKSGEGTKVVKGKGLQKAVLLPPLPQIPLVEDVYRLLPVIITPPKGQNISSYRLRVTADQEGIETIVELTTLPGEPFTLLALPDGDSYGFLTALNRDGFESLPAPRFIIHVRTKPGAPIVSSPHRGKTFFAPEVEVRWLESEYATRYFVQMASDKEFTDIIFEKTQQEAAFVSKEVAPGNYFLRVQAIAEDDFRSPFSFIDHWKIQQIPSLGDFEGSVEDGVHLNWDSMGTGILYDIQVSKNRNFTNLARQAEGLVHPEYSFENSIEAGTYFVRIRGVLPDGQVSPWTAGQILKIPSPSFGIWDAAVIICFLGLILL